MGGCLSRIPPTICCVRWKIWTSRGSLRARRRCSPSAPFARSAPSPAWIPPAKRWRCPSGNTAKVDLPYMAELLGTPGEYGRITTELSGVIFKDPCRRPHRPGSRLADGRRVPVRRCPGKAADGAVRRRNQPGVCGQCGCADQGAAQRTGSL